MVQSYSKGGANVPSMWAHWRHLANTIHLCFLRPTRVHNPNGKFIGSAIIAQLTAESPYTYNGLFFPPKLPLLMRYLESHLTRGSLGPPESSTQTASWSVQPFLHRRPQRIPILYNGTPLPPSKLPLPIRDLDPHLIHGSLGPLESSTQMISHSVQPFL